VHGGDVDDGVAVVWREAGAVQVWGGACFVVVGFEGVAVRHAFVVGGMVESGCRGVFVFKAVTEDLGLNLDVGAEFDVVGG